MEISKGIPCKTCEKNTTKIHGFCKKYMQWTKKVSEAEEKGAKKKCLKS